MDAHDLAWLRSDEGARAVANASDWYAGGATELAVLDRLRRETTSEQARAVIALIEGRRSAAGKFADATRLFFDRASAEQATTEAVARHTAARFVGCTLIADLGCGAGGDTLALAVHAPVLAVDRDPARLALVVANAEVRGLPIEVTTASVEAFVQSGTLPPDIDAIWLDPARRDESGRVRDPEQWSPPLSIALRIASSVPRAGIKVAPGIDLAAVPEGGEVEFISHDGTLVEAVLWSGSAITARRRTTVIVGDAVASLAGEPDTGATPIGAPGRYLYDLDPSVGRASLVDVVAPMLHAWRLDEHTAYLSGDEAIDSPFARRFRIDTWLPFAERRLREALDALGVTRVEVMRRASPVDTNALETRLNRTLAARGTSEQRVRTVALTRMGEAHVAIVCERKR